MILMVVEHPQMKLMFRLLDVRFCIAYMSPPNSRPHCVFLPGRSQIHNSRDSNATVGTGLFDYCT